MIFEVFIPILSEDHLIARNVQLERPIAHLLDYFIGFLKMSSGNVVSRYLPQEARAILLTELVDEGKFREVVELLDSASIEVPPEVCNRVFGLIKDKISSLAEVRGQDVSQDLEMRVLAQVACKMEMVRKVVDRWISSQLEGFIKERGYSSHLEQFSGALKDESQDTKKTDAVVLLGFLELTYLYSNEIYISSLDAILMVLLGCEDESVSSKCSQLMRWHIAEIVEKCKSDASFDRSTWKLINRVLSDAVNYTWKWKSGLSLLMRFLAVSDPTPELKNLIQRDEYWMHIRNALSQSVHEYRKLALQILQLTVKNISSWQESLHTSLISWTPSQGKSFIQSWKEFSTLYEIVSLDTALNQIEAASGGILRLLDQNSYLDPRWGLILFSTGLRASMESVRKYMVYLLFQVRDKSVFSRDLSGLRRIFLPSIMEAHFFNCDGVSCPYGDQLSSFVSEMITESGKQSVELLYTIMETLIDQGESFDPAIIYVSLGILKSLNKKNSRLINSSHLTLITKLFEFQKEDAIFESTVQTIYLRLLLHVSPSVSPVAWVDCIVSHIRRNQGSYRFFSPMAGLFEDFALSYYEKEAGRQLIGRGPTYDLMAVIIWNYEDVPATDELLIELARSGESVPVYNERATEYLRLLLSGKQEDIYESADALVDYTGFTVNTWKSIDLSSLNDSIKQRFSGSKFKFFVAIYKKCFNDNVDLFEFRWVQLKDLYDKIKESTKDNTLINFKAKDELYGFYFELLALCLKVNPLNDNHEVNELLQLLNQNVWSDNGNFKGNLGVSELCNYLLATHVTNCESREAWEYVNQIFSLLKGIWDNFSAERLVLKQRDLHLATVKGMFHPSVLLFATFPSADGKKLANELHEYGMKVIEQAYNRRGILPLMSRNFSLFMQLHGKHVQQNCYGYWWLINLMTSVFTCMQTTVNIFQIKTVIGNLFDKQIGAYNAASKGIYERIYGVEESAAKLNVIVALLFSSSYLKEFFVSETIERTNLLVAIKNTDGAEEIQRLLKWQLLLLCTKGQDKIKLLNIAATAVLPNLVKEISPIIRIYMEWFISLSISDNYGHQEAYDLVDRIFSLMDDHARPIVVVSAERIIHLVLKALKSMGSQGLDELLSNFTARLVPNATSNKPLVRHFSNSLMLDFWPSFQELLKDSTLKAVIKGLFRKAEATKMSGRYRAGDANVWDINADLTLVGIFGGVLKKTIDHDLPYISESRLNRYVPSKELFPIGHDETSLWLLKRSTNEKAAVAADTLVSESTQFQTKSGAWETLMNIDNNTPDKNVSRSDLIVVSSLVDKPPNLGGICRLCDVLGVGLLTVQDIRVKNHPQFKNVAVTADRWMPMAEVPVQEISQFMKEKKREGYVLIGLEQTDNSVQLNSDYKFPKKSLILLGTEAHGIPGDLLNQLDLCLEIQQFGVVRSMNIQTATAVIVHSYTIQHM